MPSIIVEAIMQETAMGVAQREAASVSAWANWHHPMQDAAARYAERRGLPDRDPQAFRALVDDQINTMRWAWVLKFCEQWGIPVPEVAS